MKPKQSPHFETEAALCAAFIGWLAAKAPAWTPYAETCGWDILLAHAGGTQVGIQAKLRFNMAVLSQSAEDRYYPNDVGPDFRAVLVPAQQGDPGICDALGLTLIRPRVQPEWNAGAIDFGDNLSGRGYERWHYANPAKRHPLPAYIPDNPAGVPSPSPLSRWKIGALELVAVMEIRGHLVRDDFRRAGVDHRRWVDQWLEAVPGQPGAWRWRDGNAQRWQDNHPVVYPQIFADVSKRLAA
jgi:hypothetical protein